MDTYILYHANCYDGFGAAFVAWLKLGWDAQYIPVKYGHPPPPMEPNSTIYILDFSYSATELLRLSQIHNSITVLDHHASAEKDLSPATFMELCGISASSLRPSKQKKDGFLHIGGRLHIRFDMAKSGAMLAWEYFNPRRLPPPLIQYIQDRDLWKFKMSDSRAVSAYLQTEKMEFPTWTYIMDQWKNPEGQRAMLAAGTACLRLKEQQVKIMAQNHRWVTFTISDGSNLLDHFSFDKQDQIAGPSAIDYTSGGHRYTVPAANATVFFSEVGEALLAMYPEAKFAAYYMDRGDGKRQWGLRSRPEFDCSIVAKAFGGGGHKNAAGFIQNL